MLSRKLLRVMISSFLLFSACSSITDYENIELEVSSKLVSHGVWYCREFPLKQNKLRISSLDVNLASLVSVKDVEPPPSEVKEASEKESGDGNGIVPNISNVPITGICQNQGVAQSWVDTVNKELAVIPSNLLQGFENSGWRMYCTTKNLDRTYFGGRFGAVMGVTLYEERLIYIEDRWDAVTESPVHEFGHYLDHSLGFISNKSEFRGIFNSEQGTFRRVYGVPSYFTEEELFAEAFWRYLTSNRSTMRANCPQLTAFIEKAIDLAS